jgi:hypothetical protein
LLISFCDTARLRHHSTGHIRGCFARHFNCSIQRRRCLADDRWFAVAPIASKADRARRTFDGPRAYADGSSCKDGRVL